MNPAEHPCASFRRVCAAGLLVVGLATLAQCKGKPPSLDESAVGRRTARDSAIRFGYRTVEYRVPAVYVTPPSRTAPPVFTVTYPGFQPAAFPTSPCVTWFSAEFEHKCAAFDFIVNGPDGPSREEMARNGAIPPHDAVYSTDEYGFTVSWPRKGPILRKFTRGHGPAFLSFSCFMEPNARQQLDGVCGDTFVLSDGNSVNFLFPYHLRNELPRIESGINALMTNFRIR